MKRKITTRAAAALLLAMLSAPLIAQEAPPAADDVAALRGRLAEMELQQSRQSDEVRKLREQLEAVDARSQAGPGEYADRTLAEARARAGQSGEPQPAWFGIAGEAVSSQLSYSRQAISAFNPSISVIIDTFYHYDDSGEGINHVLSEVQGFGHSHVNDHGHSHGTIEDGFNLREVELFVSAEVDPYLKAWTTIGVSSDGAHVEEAVIQTLGLPWGLEVRAGKLLSTFSRINWQHPHEMDFVDRPLVHGLMFGQESLNEVGAQVSWLAPTPFYLLAGVEILQGTNEAMFNYIGPDELPRRRGPRLFVPWLRYAPNLKGRHGAEIGVYAGRGVHQEEHDGDGDGAMDHWLDGHTTFYGTDIVYKYDAQRAHGHGDLTLQGEYIRRRMDREVREHDLNPTVIGNSRIDWQDGFYLQGVYGFLPRWRGGLRYDAAGLVNRRRLPDRTRESFDDSHRVSAMIDYNPTEFSRLRLQVSRGEYALEDGREDVWQAFLQLVVSLGAHGAHKW